MVQVRLVDREYALAQARPTRTRWDRVLAQVQSARTGEPVEVVLWPQGRPLPRNHRTRLYNAAALLRRRARQQGIEVAVDRLADGRGLVIRRVT